MEEERDCSRDFHDTMLELESVRDYDTNDDFDQSDESS